MVREQSHELTHYAIGASLIWRERERGRESDIRQEIIWCLSTFTSWIRANMDYFDVKAANSCPDNLHCFVLTGVITKYIHHHPPSFNIIHPPIPVSYPSRGVVGRSPANGVVAGLPWATGGQHLGGLSRNGGTLRGGRGGKWNDPLWLCFLMGEAIYIYIIFDIWYFLYVYR